MSAFGHDMRAMLLAPANLPEVPGEDQLLQAVRDKVGPYADQDKLQWHLRASRGKVHWAVNSYLRAVLATPGSGGREDFDPKLASEQAVPADATQQHRVQQAEGQLLGHALPGCSGSEAVGTAALVSPCHVEPTPAVADVSAALGSVGSARKEALAAAAAAPPAMQLDGLPDNMLELILAALDLASVLKAACSCSVLHRVAQAEGLWQRQFLQYWGTAVFPVSTCGSSSSREGCLQSAGAASAAVQADDAPAAAAAAAGSGVTTSGAAVAAVSSARSMHSSLQVHRAPVPLFNTQQQVAVAVAPSAAQAAASVSSSTVAAAGVDAGTAVVPAAAAAVSEPTQEAPYVVQGHQQQQQQQYAMQQLPSDAVRRWTGSCCSPSSNSSSSPHAQLTAHQAGGSTPASGGADPINPSGSLAGGVQPVGVGCSSRSNSTAPPGREGIPIAKTTAQQQQQQQQQQLKLPAGQQPEGTATAQLPAVPPAGSWRCQFRQQYGYMASRTCPKCGVSQVLPIVYGFPSTVLLEGMAAQRLVLGGDHLIDSCHVWACGGCRSCFRYFPFLKPHLWLQDDAAQQRRDQSRAAATGGSSSRQGGSLGVQGAGVGGGVAPGPGEGLQGPGNAAEGSFPRYTYEL